MTSAGRLGNVAGDVLTDFTKSLNLNPFSPPTMRTLVYSPDVRVQIEHNGQMLDISSDLVSGTIYRKENSASTAFLTVANKGGRYNGKIAPMDRITIFMKRISWVQVFSGYVDTGPHAQLTQGVVTVKATCTIKRLMHTWWNPGLPDSTKLFFQQGFAGSVAGSGGTGLDSGLGSVLFRLLNQVGGWGANNVHIQDFPTVFFNALTAHFQDTQSANNAAVEKFKWLLLSDDTSGGTGGYAQSNPSAGAPGAMGVGQAFYVKEIVAAADEMGLGPTTVNLDTAQYIADATAQGAGSRDDATKKAFESLGEGGLNLRNTTMSADGAILGVACAMAESGLRNLANPAIPDSFRFSPDGVGTDHDSVGLFQQRNFAEWGVLAERMNPRQSARMFFQHLANVDGWRNMDPGEAIYRVQRGGSPAYYAGFVKQAEALVKPLREATKGAASTVGANPLTGAVSSVGGAAGFNVGSMVNSVTNMATSMTDPIEMRTKLGKPNPDTEGAVMTALQQIGKPYVWGARGPMAFDCSGLFDYSFRSIGLNIGGWTGDQFTRGESVSVSSMKRGDLIFSGYQGNAPGHVMMYLGDGTYIHAPTPGQVVSIAPIATLNMSTIRGVRRYGENGGPDPTAPRMNPAAMGPGMNPGTHTTTGLGGGTGGTHSEPIARNLFSYIFQPDMFVNDTASLWSMAGGHKDFIDAQPLIQMVQSVSRASLRNFQSAPNGDLIFYYPDYFGLDGKPAVLELKDIELRDVHVNVSDDNLTTHVYVAGDYTMNGMADQVLSWLQTAGTATVQDEWLFQRLRRVSIGDYAPISGEDLLRRYGVRPYQTTATIAGSPELEFMLACQIFMEKWASQYETRASFSFMPELMPGMRIKFGDHNLQVYVSEVVHDFNFETGFSTTATICAPSSPNVRSQMANVVTPGATPMFATPRSQGGAPISSTYFS